MVRTHPSSYLPRIEPSRVLALSTAIALHVLALALLLIPLSQRAVPPAREAPQPRWQIPESIPQPPAPPRPVEAAAPVRPQPPQSVPVLPVAPQPLPAQEPLAAGESVAPAQAVPVTAAADTLASPASGVQLQYLRAPAPPYPRAALQARLQGTVVLRVRVDADGRPVEASVQSSSGHRVLDQAARSQVLRYWRFRPAVQDGAATQAYGLVPVSFTLQ